MAFPTVPELFVGLLLLGLGLWMVIEREGFTESGELEWLVFTRIFLRHPQQGFGRLHRRVYALTTVLFAVAMIMVGVLTLIGVISFDSR